jgi:hypothetical protein
MILALGVPWGIVQTMQSIPLTHQAQELAAISQLLA